MPLTPKVNAQTHLVVSVVPGSAEWGPESNDLDEAYARQIFYGKSIEETFPLFARSVVERASEIRFMPLAVLPYYLMAFRDYVLLDSTRRDDDAPDAASCFIGLVSERLENQPQIVCPMMDEIRPALKYLAQHQADYDADTDIYGDFEEKVAEIERRAAACPT
jgi:hypothetical protein